MHGVNIDLSIYRHESTSVTHLLMLILLWRNVKAERLDSLQWESICDEENIRVAQSLEGTKMDVLYSLCIYENIKCEETSHHHATS